MPKYLIEASYTLEGVRGLVEKGGSSRKSAVQAAAKSVGGKVEVFYFAFGATDALGIIDVPDNTAAAAFALAVAAAGGSGVRTTPLLTPEEIDAATKQEVKFKPPGK